MLKNKCFWIWIAAVLLFFAGLVVLAVQGRAQAESVSHGVLRCHIVANSDSKQDQALKLKVRDGLAALTAQLFENVDSKQEAIAVATENQGLLEQQVRQILRRNGCDDEVRVEIKNLYFPTKSYENITFPAGNYDALHIEIGKGEGENFWCVMFPALCIPSVSESNEEKLGTVLKEEDVEFVTRPYTVRFKAAELWGKLRHWLK